MTCTHKAIIVSCVLISIAILIFIYPSIHKHALSIRCAQTLRCCWSACKLYNQSGEIPSFPPSLQEAVNKINEPSLLVCPNAEYLGVHINGESDYIYVNWSLANVEQNADMAKFPLIYDSKLANHDGKGINIIMIDESTMWDENADWLRSFSFQHPAYNLQLPYDIPAWPTEP